MGACCSAVAEGGDSYGVTSGGPHGHEGGGQVEGDSTTPLVNTYAGSHVDYGLGETHEMLKELGRGGTGETYLCRVKATGELVAVKFIKRPIPKVVMPMILHEIQIQADIGEGHVNIINAHEVVLTKSHIALVMEYAAGGSMTSYVADRWETADRRGGLFLSEEEARFFFRQFLLAVEYCHNQHVAHRDLKLDNTLLDASKEPLIKICDFGFAKNWGDMDANMFTQIGTPVYMSPQLINSRGGKKGYDGKKADVWASGVLLFVMLLGMFPFEHQEHPDPNTSAAHIEVWLQQVKSSWRENPRVAEAARRLSPECQDLLDKIFNLDEKARITIQGIKSHPWFSRPLLPEHQAALDRLKHKQEQLGQLEACDSVAKHRDEALQVMMQAAARQPLPGEKLIRVDLRRLHAPGSAPDAADAAPALHKGSATTMAAIRETDEDPDASTVTPEAVKVDS